MSTAWQFRIKVAYGVVQCSRPGCCFLSTHPCLQLGWFDAVYFPVRPVVLNVGLPRGVKLAAIVEFAWREDWPPYGVKFTHGCFPSTGVYPVPCAYGGGVLIRPGLGLVLSAETLLCAVLAARVAVLYAPGLPFSSIIRPNRCQKLALVLLAFLRFRFKKAGCRKFGYRLFYPGKYARSEICTVYRLSLIHI